MSSTHVLIDPASYTMSIKMEAKYFGAWVQQGRCHGSNSVHPKNVKVLIPGTCECDLIWRWGLCWWLSYDVVIRGGPTPIWLCPYKSLNTEIDTHKGTMSQEEEGRDQVDVSTSQEIATIASNTRSQGRGPGWIFPHIPQKEPTLLTPGSQTSGLHNWDKFLLFESLGLHYLVMARKK